MLRVIHFSARNFIDAGQVVDEKKQTYVLNVEKCSVLLY